MKEPTAKPREVYTLIRIYQDAICIRLAECIRRGGKSYLLVVNGNTEFVCVAAWRTRKTIEADKKTLEHLALIFFVTEGATTVWSADYLITDMGSLVWYRTTNEKVRDAITEYEHRNNNEGVGL